MKNYRSTPPIIPLLILLVVLHGCLNKDSELELALTKKIIQHKADNISSIDLREVFGAQWKKVCLQSAYMFQTDFEKSVGENVHEFESIPDDRYAFWVFYENGQRGRVEIESVRVMDYRGGGSRCTSFRQPYLYFDVVSGEKKYFFNDKDKGELK